MGRDMQHGVPGWENTFATIGPERIVIASKGRFDRALTPDEHAEAEAHLDGCAYCRKRYRFESRLRVYLKTACREEMSPELKAKLVALRLPEA